MTDTNEYGVVLKGIGGFYYVLRDGKVYECKAGGRLRLGDISPVAGDRVTFELSGEDGLITSIRRRKNSLTRPPVANIDRLFIVASSAPPAADPTLIDTVTVIALWQDIEPIILLNKIDVDPSDELYATYTSAGFRVLRVSALTGEGIDEVRALARTGISCFTGNSGIGKSSILNCLMPERDLLVGRISKKIARGRNTTRQSELFPCGEGFVIDTPGFSAFEITKDDDVRKEQLQHYFPEITDYFDKCRFAGCAHIREPGCAVRQRVKEGLIPKTRYLSYCKIYEDLARIKDWERK
ncbi:MAG: ribosome small subunit-dependent GTPase A [Ruminococcaceae bacterium]|jgi:ribosome biogenesis GTPase|nr:ribosome small subunit-dependent GTPase A [Oscillospiraceae bacterium]